MRFDASQHMKMGQHMKLAPRMIQSMEILQMPLLQLEERIAQELESNVTLEVDEGDAQATDTPTDAAMDAATDSAAEADKDLDGDFGSTGETEGDDAGDDDAAGGDLGGESEGASEDERPLSVDQEHGAEDFGRLDSFERDNPEAAGNEFDEPERASVPDLEMFERGRATRLEGEPDAKSEAMANTASRPESLQEQLREQWGLADVDAPLRTHGEAIVGFIEDDGYLRTPLETIIDRLPADFGGGAGKPTPEQMQRALQVVQLLLDPPGVAARDTRECLLLQIDARSDQTRSPELRAQWATVRRLVSDHLEDLAQNRMPRIVEKTGLPMAEVKKALEHMKFLSLAPGRALVTEKPGVIVPDAIVEFDADQDRYIVYLNDTRLPGLRINQEYAKLAKEKEAPKPTREFLRKNLSNAMWLIDAVEQRRKTLLRVIRVVVDAQREYFDYGPQALRPLPMTQVADQLGVHVATVSRAVADKHLLTPRGVVPLRGFFSGGTHTDTGEEVSWDAIKASLKEVVDAEDKASPLSDDALAAELSKRGVEIARRTVAKYREQLNIPAARLRKQF
ncbi:MAG TPA: RNA polymerase factor sigma-54 [Phycisphaerales bacterium]|nr:RNA polymerase factor sigma-54 [Phycisphaerales bacterium]